MLKATNALNYNLIFLYPSRHQYYRQRKFSHQDSVEPKKTTEENGDAGTHKVSAPEDSALEVSHEWVKLLWKCLK